MNYSDQVLKKLKYFEKTLSKNAIYNTYLRSLDASPLFAQQAWLQITAFDLNELGIGLLHDILPIDIKPYTLDFTYVMPDISEVMQGIWAKFEPLRFEEIYPWTAELKTFIFENIKEEYQPSFRVGFLDKAYYRVSKYGFNYYEKDAYYGGARYGRSYYDPIVAREMLRATFHKLRLLRTPDISWLSTLDEISEYLEMSGVTDEHIFNRLMMIFAAQLGAFVLGLSLLGRSKLTEVKDGWGAVPFKTARGEILELHFTTLDQLQIGFILGATPLGYGYLLPKECVYKLPEDKLNPPFIDALVKKVKGIVDRLPLLAFAYSNYNKPEEMIDPHKSERTTQYHELLSQRQFVENWVAKQIPPDEANPVKVRQYQSAVQQAVAWRAKRHKWGFGAWQAMSEDEFKGWWIKNWVGQGLNETTLKSLYEGAQIWLKRLREEKLSSGLKVKQRRISLALST
jgi:hypothetical protein